jgi:hypothetical protein
VIGVILGVLINMISPSCAIAEGFEVKQKVVLPESSASDILMARVPKKGYLLTGSIRGNQAWAAFIDNNGQQEWSYSVPQDVPPLNQHVSHAWRSSRFRSAVELRNGNTLICGEKDTGEDDKPNILGMLTIVNVKGELINQKLISPGGDEYRLNKLIQCGTFGDGYFAAGTTYKRMKNKDNPSSFYDLQHFFWLIKLDGDGNILWEKLISNGFGIGYSLPWIVMGNGDIVFSGSSPKIVKSSGLTLTSGIIRINQQGEVVAYRSFEGVMQLVGQAAPATYIRLVPTELKSGGMFLKTLNDDLSDASDVLTDGEEFSVKKAIELPDHSIVLAGYRRFRMPYATLLKFSHDLKNKSSYTFPFDTESAWVDDAELTEEPYEITTIRMRTPDVGKPLQNLFTRFKIK